MALYTDLRPIYITIQKALITTSSTAAAIIDVMAVLRTP